MMTTPSAGTFGDLLRGLRKAAGLTGAELAERAGLSPRGLNDLERGARTTPRRETVTLLADALHLQGEQRAHFLTAARRGNASSPAEPGEPLTASVQPSARALTAPSLPSGTVTFLFTDIAGSIRLLQRLGSAYADALLAHQWLLRAAFTACGERKG
jgi:transcriptional regulator with XRE-family HTH domain